MGWSVQLNVNVSCRNRELDPIRRGRPASPDSHLTRGPVAARLNETLLAAPAS